MTVGDLFLIVNIISFIIILVAIYFKKFRLCDRHEFDAAVVISIIFIVNLITIIIQGIWCLVIYWNYTI